MKVGLCRSVISSVVRIFFLCSSVVRSPAWFVCQSGWSHIAVTLKWRIRVAATVFRMGVRVRIVDLGVFSYGRADILQCRLVDRNGFAEEAEAKHRVADLLDIGIAEGVCVWLEHAKFKNGDKMLLSSFNGRCVDLDDNKMVVSVLPEQDDIPKTGAPLATLEGMDGVRVLPNERQDRHGNGLHFWKRRICV